MAYDNSSRIEPKRPHPWFVDSAEAELFPNKKQAIEGPHPNSFSDFLNSNVSSWGSATSFHLDGNQFTERIFDPEIASTISFSDRNVSSVATGNMNEERKVIEDSVGSDFSFGLSISHSLEDPRTELNYGGIRKVKVSQVRDAENCMPVSVGHSYDREDRSTISARHALGKTDDNSVAIGFSFNEGDNNIISMGHTFTREDNNLISMDKPHNKDDNDQTVMGPVCRQDGVSMSLSESFNKDQCTIESLAQTFKNVDGNSVAGGHSVNMDSTVVSIGLPFSMDDGSFLPAGQTFNKGAEVSASMNLYFDKVDDNSMPISNTYNKIDDNNLSMDHSFIKGHSKIISFDGFGDNDASNASEKLRGSYDLLMGHSSVQKPETMGLKASFESNADALAKVSQITSSSEILLKKKEDQKVTKKPAPNNFPSNVRSLLSTGILDGVPVKYIAWSREKELRGTIKSSAYLCSCQSCNYSKAINAYEFERHAGCKTKHPNNHIYFESGKTVYGIVQELRNTPQNLLFEVIQTITGSPINQRSFRLWKESFLAATRELQRIYGKDEGKQFS